MVFGGGVPPGRGPRGAVVFFSPLMKFLAFIFEPRLIGFAGLTGRLLLSVGLLLNTAALAGPPPPDVARPARQAGRPSEPYQRVDPHARIAGDLQRLYRRWRIASKALPALAALPGAFPHLLVSADGQRALVRLTLRDAAALREPLATRGFELVSAKPRQHFVEGWLPLRWLAPGEAGISQLAGQGLLGVLPVYRPRTNGGLVTNQADYVHEAARVRASAGHFDGTGVRVGVMSDSYDAIGGAAAGVASGDLPANVQILQDLTAGADEGRAMCELVYDVAPGAGLAFSYGGARRWQLRRPDSGAWPTQAHGNCGVLVDDLVYHRGADVSGRRGSAGRGPGGDGAQRGLLLQRWQPRRQRHPLWWRPPPVPEPRRRGAARFRPWCRH